MAKKTKIPETPSQIDDQGSKGAMATGEDMTALASAIISRNSRLEGARATFMSQWERLGWLFMPRKSFILTETKTPTIDRETRLFTSCGVNANNVLAAGCMSYITPSDSRWMSYQAPDIIEDQPDVKEYFARVTEIIASLLASSNFYTCVHEFFLDRNVFANAVLFVEPGDTDDTKLIFKTFDCGTYCFAENHEGLIDTLFTKNNRTVRNVVQEFGLENVSEQTREKYNQPNGQGWEEEVAVIHAIYPRADRDREKGKKDGKNKAFASVYVEERAKHVLRNGGYDEKPFFASRYLRWFKDSVYGYGPAFSSFADMNQLNFLERMMDTLAEVKINPRILAHAGIAANIDMKAGGVTEYNDATMKPEQWLDGGDYQAGIERIQAKEKNVEKAFCVPLFQQFDQEEQKSGTPITATEVRARQAEQLANFSPTFSRLTTEVLTPLLIRLYGISARMGWLPQIPQSLIQQSPSGDPKDAFIPPPKIAFNSRMALAVKAMEGQANQIVVNAAVAIAKDTGDQTVLDNIDLAEYLRTMAFVSGADPDIIRPVEQVQAIQQQRAQAQQLAAQQTQEAHMADMAKKIGSIKPDSPVGEKMQSNQPGQ